MTMSGVTKGHPTDQDNAGFDLRQVLISGVPVLVLMAVAFGFGYSQGTPAAVDSVPDILRTGSSDPEVQRAQEDLSGNIVKARVQSHLERYACLQQVQFTTVELETAGGTTLEAMLPLQVTTLDSAKKLFPAGKVESFRLSKVENIKASDGTDLYAITDAAMQVQQ